jgi:hypothetical protein
MSVTDLTEILAHLPPDLADQVVSHLPPAWRFPQARLARRRPDTRGRAAPAAFEHPGHRPGDREGAASALGLPDRDAPPPTDAFRQGDRGWHD